MNTEEVPDMAAKKASPGGKGTSAASRRRGAAADAADVKPYVVHVNTQTRQVMKVEEFNPDTGERKEIKMDASGYDPYSAAGYDPYGAYSQSGYDPYGAGGYDPYAASG